MAATERRQRILAGAKTLLSAGGKATVDDISAAAGVSKTAFYREFPSRAALVRALRMTPEPATGERVLRAALEMIGSAGLSALSMDELAVRAGVSRATLYRLFPGKPALFVGLVRAYSPLEAVSRVAIQMRDEPPEVVMPEVARTVFRVVAGPDAPGIGLIRAVFFEVSSLSPEAESAAQDLVTTIFGTLGAYVMKQMAAGRLRMVPPVLALQSFIGPIFFYLLTRPVAKRVMGFDPDGEEAVNTLAEGWLRAMKPDTPSGDVDE